LIVVDGTYTTMHLGPRPVEDFKETFRLNLTLAGYDPIAIDTVGAKIFGINPETLRFLKWGEEKGLGTRDLAKIKTVGTSIEEAYFGKAVGIVEFVNTRMKKAKILDYGACTGCLQQAAFIMQFSRMLKNKTVFVMGPQASAANLKEHLSGGETIVLCGDCAAPTFYNGLQGHFVPGCPLELEALLKKLKELFLSR